MSIAKFKNLFRGQECNFERRTVLIWETGTSKERLSSKTVMVENAGFEHADDIFLALHPGAMTAEEIFDDNYSEEYLLSKISRANIH